MPPIPVMVNGIPGKVAGVVARHVLADPRFSLIPCSFTGPEIQESEHRVEDIRVRLFRPDEREAALAELLRTQAAFLSVDYTHPTAVNANAEFYCRHGLPFVMGTTGGDRKALEETVRRSDIRRRDRTQHGQADRRVPGHDGVRGPELPGPVQGLPAGDPRKPPEGQGRHERHRARHGCRITEAAETA